MSLPPMDTATSRTRARLASRESSVSWPGSRDPDTGSVRPSSRPGTNVLLLRVLLVRAPAQARFTDTVPGSAISAPRDLWHPGEDSPVGVSQ